MSSASASSSFLAFLAAVVAANFDHGSLPADQGSIVVAVLISLLAFFPQGLDQKHSAHTPFYRSQQKLNKLHSRFPNRPREAGEQEDEIAQ